jgi:hypothetical protein
MAQWADIPDELVLMIIKHIPMRLRYLFGQTCKRNYHILSEYMYNIKQLARLTSGMTELHTIKQLDLNSQVDVLHALIYLKRDTPSLLETYMLNVNQHSKLDELRDLSVFNHVPRDSNGVFLGIPTVSYKTLKDVVLERDDVVVLRTIVKDVSTIPIYIQKLITRAAQVNAYIPKVMEYLLDTHVHLYCESTICEDILVLFLIYTEKYKLASKAFPLGAMTDKTPLYLLRVIVYCYHWKLLDCLRAIVAANYFKNDTTKLLPADDLHKTSVEYYKNTILIIDTLQKSKHVFNETVVFYGLFGDSNEWSSLSNTASHCITCTARNALIAITEQKSSPMIGISVNDYANMSEVDERLLSLRTEAPEMIVEVIEKLIELKRYMFAYSIMTFLVPMSKYTKQIGILRGLMVRVIDELPQNDVANPPIFAYSLLRVMNNACLRPNVNAYSYATATDIFIKCMYIIKDAQLGCDVLLKLDVNVNKSLINNVKVLVDLANNSPSSKLLIMSLMTICAQYGYIDFANLLTSPMMYIDLYAHDYNKLLRETWHQFAYSRATSCVLDINITFQYTQHAITEGNIVTGNIPLQEEQQEFARTYTRVLMFVATLPTKVNPKKSNERIDMVEFSQHMFKKYRNILIL